MLSTIVFTCAFFEMIRWVDDSYHSRSVCVHQSRVWMWRWLRPLFGMKRVVFLTLLAVKNSVAMDFWFQGIFWYEHYSHENLVGILGASVQDDDQMWYNVWYRHISTKGGYLGKPVLPERSYTWFSLLKQLNTTVRFSLKLPMINLDTICFPS